MEKIKISEFIRRGITYIFEDKAAHEKIKDLSESVANYTKRTDDEIVRAAESEQKILGKIGEKTSGNYISSNGSVCEDLVSLDIASKNNADEIRMVQDKVSDMTHGAVSEAISAYLSSDDAPIVTSVNGRKGVVTISPGDIGAATSEEVKAAKEEAKRSYSALKQEIGDIDTGVISFNGRKGDVLPKAGDYDLSKISYNGGTAEQEIITINRALQSTNEGYELLGGFIQNLIEYKQDKLTFDEEPTPNSQNPAKSGGIFAFVERIRTTLASSIQSVQSDLQTKIDKKFDKLNGAISGKVDRARVVNNDTTTTSGYVLDARRGKAHADAIAEVKKVTNAVPVIKRGVNDGISGVFTGFLTGGGKEIYINFPVIRDGYGLSFTNADKIYIRQNGNYLWDTDNSGEEATKLKMEFNFTDALPCGWIVIKRADGKAFANGTNNDVVAVQIGKMTLNASK